jgi:hypothetical protein
LFFFLKFSFYFIFTCVIGLLSGLSWFWHPYCWHWIS